MKKLVALGGMFLMVAWSGLAAAELPRTINLQTMVYDLDGNVTRSEFVDVSVQIVDENGSVYFQEDHYDVPIVQGAMNLLIGEASGGIGLAALDPAEGRRFVNVLVDNTNPFDILPLSSVPYAIWADRAQSVIKDAITGENIKDGSIEPRHFAGDFQIDKMTGTLADVQIPENIVRIESLESHTNSETAHQAGTITVINGAAYPLGMGTTVQVALEKLYSAHLAEVSNRQTADTSLSGALATETNARKAADTSLSNALSTETAERKAADAALQAQLNTAPPPNQYFASSWGHVGSCLMTPASASCYNATAQVHGFSSCKVTFQTPMVNASYAVLTTPALSVTSRDTTGFILSCGGVAGCAFDFAVFDR